MNITARRAPTARTAHLVYAGASASNKIIHIRMSDNSSRLVRVDARPSGKFLNGIVGLDDDRLEKTFGKAISGRRKKQ